MEFADMTQENIIRMAREAGDDWDSTLSTDKKFLKRFAALVAAEEREACAKVCEDLGMATNGMYERNHECAAAIRARLKEQK
jgi:hypothetical protein